MKYHESSSLFNYSWEQVTQAFWKRYPNPQSSHVLTEDTISREVRNGNLYSKRLLTKTNRVPKWGERFISSSSVKIIEESIVDPKEKTLTTYTRNVGLARVMSVVEKVTYKVSPDNNSWTIAHRSAWIDSQVFGFSRAIAAFGLDRFKKNCKKTVLGFNYVLSEMFPNLNADDNVNLASSKAEKLRDAARKATDIAKSKASSMFATCEPSESLLKE